MRCFFAIELPEATILALDAAGRAIRDIDAAWAGEKWAAPGVMHVTLKFLGDLDEQLIARLESDFAATASEQAAFALQFPSLRAVPRPRRASMIWAAVDDPSGCCGVLARAADRVASQNGLEPEARPFTPHVTLVRARRPLAAAPDMLVEAARRSDLGALNPVSVLSATLFASTLTPHGPIHERLVEFALQAE